MNGVKGVAKGLKLALALLVLAFIGCSGGDGTDGTGEKPAHHIDGTAAVGNAIASSPISIKSSAGERIDASTDERGKYHIDVQGMTGPFLIRVDTGPNKHLYSIASKPGISNVHPITDLIIRNWFKVQGRDVEVEFEDQKPIIDPPSENDIKAVKSALAAILSQLLSAFNVPDSFDLINHAFEANGKDFDDLLDHLKVLIENGKVKIRITDPDTNIEAELADDLDLDTDLTQADTVAPQAKPGARILGFGASNSEIIVVWTPFTDNIAVSYYEVYRDGVLIDTTPFPVYWDKQLTQGVEYCYSVKAFDAAGNFSSNLETSAPCPMTQVDTTPPSAPLNLTTSVTQAPTLDSFILQLGWDAVVGENVIAYEIHRNINHGAYSTLTTVVEAPFSDFDLAPNTTYCYTVSSIKATDATLTSSPASAEVCETTPADAATLTPLVEPIADYTTSTSLVVSGSAEPLSDITVSGGAVQASGKVTQSGAFSVNVELTANATNNLSLFAKDPANNQSPLVALDRLGNPLSIVHDNTPPAVTTVDPANNATNVSVDKVINISFNDNLRAATANTTNIQLKAGTNLIAGAITLNGNMVSFTPTNPLTTNTTYKLEIAANKIQDLAGNVMANAFSSSFTTGTGNQPPTAVIQAIIPSVVAPGSTVQLNGSGSTDPNAGDTLRYSWSFNSKPANSTAAFSSSTAPNPTFIADLQGSYEIQLIVTDNANLSSAPAVASVTASVSPNNAPTAVIASLPASIPLNTDVNLDGSGSYDPDPNDSLSYQWTVTKPDATTANLLPSANVDLPHFVADLKGDYTVELIVTDNSNVSSVAATATFNVPNSAPTAVITSTPALVYRNDVITLDATSSSDPDVNDTLRYEWVLVSQPAMSIATLSSTTAPTVTLTGDFDGDYIIALTVFDNENASSAQVSTTITVHSPILNCGSLYTDVLTNASEVDNFTLSGNAGDVILLTLVESGGALATSPAQAQWNMTAPSQNPVGTPTNANRETRIVLPETGSYVVGVRASDLTTTGEYHLGLSCIAPLGANTPMLTAGLVNGNIDTMGKTDVYGFAGNVGDVVNFTLANTAGFSGATANFALYTPSGLLVNNTSYNANRELRFTLSETGNYAIRIIANNLVGTGSYALGFQKLLPAKTANLAPGDLITSSITQVAEQQIYYVDGNVGEIMNFILVQTSGFTGAYANFQLISPSGIAVNNTSYNANRELRFTLGETGTYVVRIMANNLVATGTYKLGLEKFIPATKANGIISPGDLLSASIIEAGQQDFYTFSGTAGNIVNFTIVQTAGFTGAYANFQLIAPSGATVNNTSYNANRELRFTLSESGSYVVRITANNLVATGSYSLGFEVFNPITAANGAIAPGDLLSSSITAAGQQDFYTYAGTTGEVVNFILVQSAGFTGAYANFELIAPSGATVNNTSYNSNRELRFTLNETGTYIIRITANNLVATGDYKLGLEKFVPATLPNATIKAGDLLSGNITQSGQQDLYTFSGAVGDIVNFTIVQTAGFTGAYANFQLIAPSGATVNNTSYNANREIRFTLNETGTYVVRITANNLVATGSYSLGMETFNSVTSANGAIAPGDMITASLIAAGQQDYYTYDGVVGEVVNFTLVQSSGFTGAYANFQLIAPSGATVNNTSYNSNRELRFTLNETGTYVIRITANNLVATGTYKVGMEKFIPATLANGVIAAGDLLSATLIESAQQDFYTFNGTSGQIVNFTIVQTSGFVGAYANFQLIAPSGATVNNTSYNANRELRFTLNETGTYVIRITANNLVATGSYSLGMELFKPATLANNTLTAGDLLTASITQAGQQDFYTFTGSVNEQVNLTLVQTAGFTGAYANLQLISPSGVSVNNTSYNSNREVRFKLTEAGTYVVRVTANNLVATGNYSLGFEIFNPATAANKTLLPGDLVNASIIAAGQQDFYIFDGSANDIVDFTIVQTAGFTGAYANFQLIAPSGGTVNNASYNANRELRFTLGETGTYVVRIMANNIVATGDYALGFEKLSPAAGTNGGLTATVPVNGSISAAGQMDIYTFTSTANTVVTLSMAPTAGFTGTNVNFYLLSPSGALVNNISYNGTVSPQFTLPLDGEYVVRVSAQNLVGTGSYTLTLQ